MKYEKMALPAYNESTTRGKVFYKRANEEGAGIPELDRLPSAVAARLRPPSGKGSSGPATHFPVCA